MKVPKISPLLLFGLPLVAIFCGVCAVTDRDVNDLDTTRIGQVTCSDYPAGAAPADCVTSQDVLMNDGDGQFIERPVWAILAVLIILAWAAILIADLRKPTREAVRPEQKTPPPTGRTPFGFMALTQTIPHPDDRTMWLRDEMGLLIAIGIGVLAAVALYFAFRGAKRDDT